MKIAHLSDLHFSKIIFHPKIFFSKRFVGIFNLILNRKKLYKEAHLYELPKLLKNLKVDYLFITGDLTSTSLKKEFKKAKKFIEEFDKDIQVFIIPGNHDHYTKKAFKQKTFYEFFNRKNVHLLKTLKNEKIEAYELSKKWYYIGLDTCIPTHLFACSGLFSKDLEKHLIDLLENIPKSKNIILINHFPIIHEAQNRKILKRREVLFDIIKRYSNIKLYLHGHTHTWSMEKIDKAPLMLGSGCVSYKKNASFNILEIEDTKCSIINYLWKKDSWQENTFNQVQL